ncbi:MAG: hypothetical protein SVV80_04855, partial [Planctomycetota bacterium]|nr:hypothetical protein [Planctomycetota bacterium]
GSTFSPLTVHIPHEPLGPPEDYLTEFSCTPRFSQPKAGFTQEVWAVSWAVEDNPPSERGPVMSLHG